MKSERMHGLGARIKSARMALGMSQDYVARSLGGTRQAVSAWERGIASPSAIQLAELSELFCVCAHELLFGDSFAKSGIRALMVRKIEATGVRKPSVVTGDQRPWSMCFFAGFLAAGERGAAAALVRTDGAGGDLAA